VPRTLASNSVTIPVAVSAPHHDVETPCFMVSALQKCSIWTKGVRFFAKMKLTLAILVVYTAACFAAPIISPANKVAVNFYMESL